MDINVLKEKLWEKYLKSNDSEIKERYEHSLNVADRAVEIVRENKLDIDEEKIYVAGLVHDYAKFLTMEDFYNIVKEYDLDSNILEMNFKVLHSFLGPYVIKKELGIMDEDILKAVEFHTTGKTNMDLFTEVLFVADFTEVGREGIEEVKRVAKTDLRKAVALILDFKLNKSIRKNNKLHFNTIKAYDYYKDYLDSDEEKINKIIKAMDHNLVKNTIIYNMKKNTPLFDYMIITTALSKQQMDACVNYLREEFIHSGIEKGDAWTLVDLQDVIVQIFLEEEREKYALDKLFKDLSKRVVN